MSSRVYSVFRTFPLSRCSIRYSSHYLIKEGDPTSKAIWNAAKPFKKIPGPPSWPLVGTLPTIIKDRRHSSEDYLITWHKRYGSFYKSENPSYINGRTVSCYDPNLLKLVLQSSVKNNSRNISLENKMASIHRKMKSSVFMFFASGEEWKTLRSAMNKPSTPRRVAMFSSQLYDTAYELGSYWLEKRDENGVIDDIRDDLQKWALKGVTWFAFNKDLSVFGESDEMSEEFNKAAITFLNSLLSMILALPLYKIYPTAAYKNFLKSVHSMHAIGEKLMQSRFEELQKLTKEGHDIDSERISLMEHLLIEGTLTKETALSQVCDLLAAGVDTTSSTAGFLLHHIANDPQLQEALFDEISSVCGVERAPDFNELQQLTLVRNCVKETLRLYPPGKLLLRNAEYDMVVNGYQVPKNTSIIFNIMLMGKDPNIYSNPSVFNPYRWNSKELDDIPFANLPFGAGVRMCYGRRLAELELHLLLVTMIQRFVLSTDQSSLSMSQMFVLKPGENVRLKIEER